MGASDGLFSPAVEDEDRQPDLEPPTQKPLAIRSADYAETGFLPVGMAPDGGPLIGGGAPPGPAPWLTDENLVCVEAEGRPACAHYTALLMRADGEAKGFDPMFEIRRYCTRLSTAAELMEIGDRQIVGCSARSPAAHNERITLFELKQKRVAAEVARERGELDL